MIRLIFVLVIMLSVGCGYAPAMLSGVSVESRSSDDRNCNIAVDSMSIVSFLDGLAGVDSVSASAMVAKAFDAVMSDVDAYRMLAEMAMTRLLDVTSPTADDESFIVVADRLLADRLLSESDLLRVADARSLAMLNRVGHKAADFEIVTRSGSIAPLSEFVTGRARTLLIFYDPDCHDCAEFENHISAMALDSVGVVMVSPYGEQDGLWKAHAATMPDAWIVGRPVDEGFEDADLYDIVSTPTVLLLDRDCVVIAKNINLLNVDRILDVERMQ